MTPCEIEALIHCYVSPTRHPRFEAPAVRDALQGFLDNGMIYSDPDAKDDVYRTTKKGAAHIKQLCDLPYPTQEWVGADGEIITDY